MNCIVTVVSKSSDVVGSLVGFTTWAPHMHLAFGDVVPFSTEPEEVSPSAVCRSLADTVHDLTDRIRSEYAEDSPNGGEMIRLADRIFWIRVTLQGMKCC